MGYQIRGNWKIISGRVFRPAHPRRNVQRNSLSALIETAYRRHTNYNRAFDCVIFHPSHNSAAASALILLRTSSRAAQRPGLDGWMNECIMDGP